MAALIVPLLLSVLVYEAAVASARPYVMRKTADSLGVVPVGCVDGDSRSLVGIELAPESERACAWGTYPRFSNARLWWLRGGVREAISAQEVWGLARTGRLRWYYQLGAYSTDQQGRVDFASSWTPQGRLGRKRVSAGSAQTR